MFVILPDTHRMSILTFSEWLATPPGRYLLDWERNRIDSVVADIFGFAAVQIGMPEIDYLQANRMPSRFHCAETVPADVLARATALPFECASLDLAVLPHILEFSDNPHQVLREVERILLPEGHVVIAGFNPYSLWGIRHYMKRKEQNFPWRGQYISMRRLKDWLQLLGFETRVCSFGCYAPPAGSERWLHRWRFMDTIGRRWGKKFGGAYLLQGVKRVSGMRLIQPEWRKNKASAKKSLPAVAQRTPTTRTEESL